MEYRFLQEEDFPQLYSAFIEAFSDYAVKMQPSEEQFFEMLTRRGVRYDLSVGAFSGQRLAGFNLNALDLWKGRLTVYDTGTGVIPGYRGQGIASDIFAFSFPKLKQVSAQQYILEVIDSNLSAIKLYERVGFREVRRLQSFRLSDSVRRSFREESTGIELKVASEPDWDMFQSFWDWGPSWQNSINSIKRSLDNKVLVCSFSEGSCAGYGIVYPSNGDIPQLAVNKGYRRRRVGTQILQSLEMQIRNGQSGRMVNIDASAEGTLGFCKAVGMQKIVNQYEMLLELS
jgi:ribosomal protein S18 acetylase RimI-like enzyme